MASWLSRCLLLRIFLGRSIGGGYLLRQARTWSARFEDQVNQLSSGVYSVSGSLEEPEVVFERVFDAKTR